MHPETPAMLLCFDIILATEHVVDALEVVNALGDRLRTAIWRIALLQVCLLAQIAHLGNVC
jgi:hypothetical protein